MNPYWQFYDRLIDLAKKDEIIRNVDVNLPWVFVLTDTDRIGAAMFTAGQPFDVNTAIGMRLSDAAKWVKSWNFPQASVGLAAINASLNRRERFAVQEDSGSFTHYMDHFINRKIVAVGHFASLEKHLEGKCDLSVLERSPVGNDIPDPGCEYLLPEADTVIITGSAIINKTMPRLLELSKHAFTIVSGPSTPMTDVLFDYGVNSVSGFCVTDKNVLYSSDVQQAQNRTRSNIFRFGERVCMEP